MDQKEKIVNLTKAFVKEKLSSAEGGHDWWHAFRVRNLASKIATEEKGNLLVVELAALLHDIADSKFHDGNEEIGPLIAGEFLESLSVERVTVDHVKQIIRNISFKGEFHPQKFTSPELDIVQDADRLDALGAIGIARTFNYGGFKGREIYNPDIPPQMSMSKAEYIGNSAPSINHFYEKLLLLKDKMNTASGKKMAIQRHEFINRFLDEFYREWNEV